MFTRRVVCSLRAAVALGILAALATTALGADNDWQLWTAFNVKVEVTDNFGVFATPQLRWQDNWDTWFYERYDLGLSFKVSERWRVEPLYSRIEKKSGGDWDVSDLLSADVYYTAPMGLWDMQFENRVRLEKNFDTEREAGRERVKLSKNLPGVDGLSAFVSDEIIYDFSGGDLTENRAAIGLSKKFEHGVSAGAAYQLTSKQKEGDWDDFNTLVVNLGLSL